MRYTLFIILAIGSVLLLTPAAILAAPDRCVGDTAIYGGSSADMQPNVLLILDTSGSMESDIPTTADYDPANSYAASSSCGGSPCTEQKVYKCTAFGLECANWTNHVADVATVSTSCGGVNPFNSLTTLGQWNSSQVSLNNDGSCKSSGSGVYATGNWINWRAAPPSGPTSPKFVEAKKALVKLLDQTAGVNFGLMTFDSSGNEGGEFLEEALLDGTSPDYVSTIKSMSDNHSATYTNKTALQEVINNAVVNLYTPLAETMYEANRYFAGESPAFNQSGSYLDADGNYVSPINGSCQANYVVLITDGMSTKDTNNVLRTICNDGDCDGDGFEPSGDSAKTYSSQGSDYLDDVTKYMFERDYAAFTGTQNVSSFMVAFGGLGSNAGAIKLLNEAAFNGGTQQVYVADDAAALADVLSQILGHVFEVDTSFVAPVVPTSPENKTYSGSRIYLGFFKPINGNDWQGNLKKFGLDSLGNVVDRTGAAATGVDGTFLTTASSFWGTTTDSGKVDDGGVGLKLRARSDLNPAGSTPRKIYTNRGTNANLTDASNIFGLSIPPADLGFLSTETTERDNLVKYIYGLDAYDDDGDGSVTDTREWVLGDILHSKPAIVTFSTYLTDEDLADATNTHDENSCPSSWSTSFTNVNKTVIFVGGNDGMLHAFSDCNGEELWSFIPDVVLPNLNQLHNYTHNYFIDSSATVYKYDKSYDGNIGAGPTGDDGSSDRVILVFGQRRGGGRADNIFAAGSWGTYYALDVTDPSTPILLWQIDRTTTGFSELGETWSQPTLGRIQVTSGGTDIDKIVAFFGAGYDNLNEDGRYGNTQTYIDASVALPTSDTGTVTSSGSVAASALTNNPKGRGVFAIEIATLDSSGVPTIASTPTLLWEFTPDTTNNIGAADIAARGALDYSIPTDIAAIDTNFDGYTDHLYFVDTGGQLWRVSAHDSSNNPLNDSHLANWYGKVIFSANPGTENTPTNGRKAFYRPSVVVESTYNYVFFGTGDRPHPLNRGVAERIYAIKDQGQDHLSKTDANLEDLTLNKLQDPTTPLNAAASDGVCTANEVAIKCINERLSAVANYGWHISLNENPGEKIMAPVLAFNGVLYSTTFTTEAVVVDPCRPGNLGTGRLYAMNYTNATAAMDLDSTNGTTISRSDRGKVIGVGIPSGVVVVLPKEGDAHIIAGAGGGIMQNEATPGGLIQNLYWREK